MSLKQEIIKILKEELQVETLHVVDDTCLVELPGWDSVSMSCVMLSLEHNFRIDFSGAELENLSSFRRLVELVESKKQNSTQSNAS